jgi:hypothetical protein
LDLGQRLGVGVPADVLPADAEAMLAGDLPLEGETRDDRTAPEVEVVLEVEGCAFAKRFRVESDLGTERDPAALEPEVELVEERFVIPLRLGRCGTHRKEPEHGQDDYSARFPFHLIFLSLFAFQVVDLRSWHRHISSVVFILLRISVTLSSHCRHSYRE